MNWSKEWPNEKGFYWLFGWRFKQDYETFNDPPSFHLVKVTHAISGRSGEMIAVYTTNGHFLYKSEGAKGLWAKCEFPEQPSEDLMEELYE